VRVYWSPVAQAAVRRYLTDQDGIRAINTAVAALTADPNPPEAFVRGSYRRLKVGLYRVAYVVEGDAITIERLDRLEV
jgi:mRNA-degrading endonuclease RelE of RelBE toxin-antitoxin system